MRAAQLVTELLKERWQSLRSEARLVGHVPEPEDLAAADGLLKLLALLDGRYSRWAHEQYDFAAGRYDRC